ncbi:MAG: hypothetical protein MJZ35_07875 [Bacteroidaceae bacterium]|nr:hypothetical protein [Bacteroidaceae bacterium]
MMKNVKVSFVLAALSVVACTGNSSQSQGEANDSMAVEQATEASAPAAAATSADLRLFQFVGRVQRCVESTGTTYSFDADGQLTSYERAEEEVESINRDESGRIVSITCTDLIGRGFADEYECDEEGRLLKAKCDAMPDGLSYSHTYEYDEQGRVTKITGWSDGPGNLTIMYSYREVDEKGNWTKRDRSLLVEGETDPVIETETRDIQYYE